MKNLPVVSVIEPQICRMYVADVPLRLWDWGKWSDVEKFMDLIGGGAVLNLSGRLRLWGSDDPFSGVIVTARVLPPSVFGGRVVVRAGADPKFNANCAMEELRDQSFNHDELALCALSMIDFSRIAPCDLDITVVAPIPPGASLGTSAALGVAIERAFLGDAHDPRDIAERALFAEKEIAGRNTGRQDHDAAAWGSHRDVRTPAIGITMNSLWDAEVTPLTVGEEICCFLKNTLVIYLGYHDSSGIHQALMDELQRDVKARTKLRRIRQTAEVAWGAIRDDDPVLLSKACRMLIDAQKELSPKLIGDKACALIDVAERFGGFSCVPGAGGEGGSLIVSFPTRQLVEQFVSAAKRLRIGDLRFYEVAYPGLP